MIGGYNFTERVRAVLELARKEVLARQHTHVRPEHMLLGILIEGSGVGSVALQNMGIDPAEVMRRVDAALTPGTAHTVTGPDMPYDDRAKQALSLAMTSAREMAHGYVGTEHLLLGVIREKHNHGAKILAEMGVTFTRLRDEMLRLLGTPLPRGATKTRLDDPDNSSIEGVVIELRMSDGSTERHEFPYATSALDFLHRLVAHS